MLAADVAEWRAHMRTAPPRYQALINHPPLEESAPFSLELALDPEDFRVLSGLHLFLLMRGKLNDDVVELSMFSQGEAC